MVRQPSEGLVAASRDFVCVRVTDMKGVDLAVYRFDWDLTFAALVMAPDGRVLHQYGNRTPEGAESRLSMASLERLLRGTTAELAAAPRAAAPAPAAHEPWSVDGLATMRRRVEAGKAPECFHCHFVYQGLDEAAQEAGTYDRSAVWRWPPATRVGIDLARDDQTLVEGVTAGSPAALAGLRAGDRLARVAGQAVLTEGDVQSVLEDTPGSGAGLPVVVRRGDAQVTLTLALADGWRVGAPEDLWRPSMWRLDPKPGFGGPPLSAEEKRAHGIDEHVAAFRVKYLVTWGPDADTGRRAQDAGLRKGDIVLSVAGKDDFRSQQHFHAWFRLTQTAGEPVPIEVQRGDRRLTVTLWARD